MSPTKLKPRKVKGSGKDSRNVTISTANERIQVNWLCGDLRQFTVEDLTEQIQRIELFAERWPGVWVTDKDSNGQDFAIKVEGGRFYAEARCVNNATECVSWVNLKNALTATLKGLQEPATSQQEG